MTARNKMALLLFVHGVDSAKYEDDILDYPKGKYENEGDRSNSELASKTVHVIQNLYTYGMKELKYKVKCVNLGSLLI